MDLTLPDSIHPAYMTYLALVSLTPSSKEKAPAYQSAEYSPRDRPMATCTTPPNRAHVNQPLQPVDRPSRAPLSWFRELSLRKGAVDPI
jgi:hypothetical protein